MNVNTRANTIAQRVMARRVERSDRSPGPLQAGALGRVDFADAWSTPLLPKDSTDPEVWMRAIAGGLTSGLVGRLMQIRNLLVRPFGVLRTDDRTLPPTGFPVLDRSDGGELLMGLDDRHLNFRVGVVIDERVLHLITTVKVHDNLVGRGYWSIVRRAHPFVVWWMLRRAPVPVAAG